MPRDNTPPPGDNVPESDAEEFQRIVRRFAKAHRIVLTREPEPLPEYGAFKNAVLDAVESSTFINETSRALAAVHDDPNTTEAAHLLMMELEAFSASVDRTHAAVVQVGSTERPLWKRLLGIGKTASDSLREILDKFLGPKAKAIWKLLTELVDIARGD